MIGRICSRCFSNSRRESLLSYPRPPAPIEPIRLAGSPFAGTAFACLALQAQTPNSASQWIHYLSVVASVAPMTGLLGTVSGMIGGFQTMATGGMGRPELFAGDIGEAPITTATGLCGGIPAMIAHSAFNKRPRAAIAETARHANSPIDALPKP